MRRYEGDREGSERKERRDAWRDGKERRKCEARRVFFNYYYYYYYRGMGVKHGERERLERSEVNALKDSLGERKWRDRERDRQTDIQRERDREGGERGWT